MPFIHISDEAMTGLLSLIREGETAHENIYRIFRDTGANPQWFILLKTESQNEFFAYESDVDFASWLVSAECGPFSHEDRPERRNHIYRSAAWLFKWLHIRFDIDGLDSLADRP